MRDIPPQFRKIMAVAAAGGFIFIIMGSLASETQIGLDKIIHAGGYGLLGILCIMGLSPLWYIPAFIGIAIGGIGLEFAQKAMLPGRQMEFADVVANSIGFLAGSCIGFLLRYGWGYVQSEIMDWINHERFIFLKNGETLFRQGDSSKEAFVLRKGILRIYQEDKKNSSTKEIAIIKPGEVVGEMGAIENVPRSATAEAQGNVVALRISAKEILGDTEEEREHPALSIARVLAKRLRAANTKNET